MKRVTVDGNSACANIAYLMNDLAIIYPITPSSTMSEMCDNMNSQNIKNIFGNKLEIRQMQSEAGVAGAVHGALSSGSLCTTFTSSQGLLLMLPNMYKIAGELLPTVFYVASRSVATHALNIFCDHSDIYSCLKTGFNIISCSSVQEVNDMAIACNLAALKSSTPFICFFDGFRTSHEISTIEQTTIDELNKIVDFEDIKKFKSRALNTVSPFLKGTNQNPDVFFQNRVASLNYYSKVTDIVKDSFKKVETITHRSYDTIEYYGSAKAQDIIVSMGSSVDSLLIAQTLTNKTGVIKIRLLKPFDEKTFIEKLPKTVKNITILDRNLDTNGADTLYSYIVNALFKNQINCSVYAGVYGLGGKEFTPDMAIACFNNMRVEKKQFFTVGIDDNVENTSIEVKEIYKEDDTKFSCRIYGFGSDGSVSSAKNIIKILGENSNNYAQGYFEYDSKKSGSLTISHIRTSSNKIEKPFNSSQVKISMCNNPSFITKYDMTSCIKENGIFLINCDYTKEKFNEIMPNNMKNDIIKKNITIYTINANEIARTNNLRGKINTIMQTALFKINPVMPFKTALNKIKKSIVESYAKKGDEIVSNNLNAILSVEKNIRKIKAQEIVVTDEQSNRSSTDEYYNEIIYPTLHQQGNSIPVSKFSPDGSMPTGTAQLEKRGVASQIPEWVPENCIQCGRCTMMCPHACIRPVLIDKDVKLPKEFKTANAFGSDKKYHLQVSPLDCTGCGVCSQVCPVKNKALQMTDNTKECEIEKQNYELSKQFETNERPNNFNTRTMQFLRSYFEFSGACAGCGETPYIKLVSQLFGDRMIIANATGCSSIYGGTFPTCPYTKDNQGFGPSWANSLFEDNAEFGYGIKVSANLEREHFISKLKLNKSKYSKNVKDIIETFLSDTDNHEQNKEIVEKLKFYKCTRSIQEDEKEVFENLRLFIKPSIWIIGGDGWAYDIGFGGLDHIVSTGENVNILILDTEIYSNTGGQTSKSTPRGATAKFNVSGKLQPKKDILSMLMTYKNVYLAQVSMGANTEQCLKAFEEAEKFDGPSVIVAYSPCINHGYDMTKSQEHCLNAVKSGYVTLFRYNPNTEPHIQIDSKPTDFSYEEFCASENRFNILSKTNPENKEKLIELSKQDAENRKENYQLQTRDENS